MTPLRRIDDAAIVVGIGAGIVGICVSIGAVYDAWWRRRRDRQNDERDRRVHDLESRIERLEQAKGESK